MVERMRMRLRAIVTIALLVFVGGLAGSAALATSSSAHHASTAASEVLAPHVAGSPLAAPVTTSSLRSAYPFAALAGTALMLFLAIWFATDASLRMPAFALLRSIRRRRAPPLLLV
jgi:hypothetical protein